MEKCFECKEKYCYDHIKRGHNKTMGVNDEIRPVCEICFEKFNYKLLS